VGLDVYVGSLTRYYLEGSADVVERIAHHQGLPVDDGQDGEEVIRAAVLRWRDGLSRWLGDRLAGPLDWDESGPAPCFTDKPGWDGYGGALLLAAHDEHPGLPPPAWCRPTGPTTSPIRPPRLPTPGPGTSSCSPRSCGSPAGSSSPSGPGTSPARRSSSAPAWPCSTSSSCCRLDGRPGEPALDGHSLSAAAGNGLAVLLRLAERSVGYRIPMKLDF
jgi:hypothetical protein